MSTVGGEEPTAAKVWSATATPELASEPLLEVAISATAEPPSMLERAKAAALEAEASPPSNFDCWKGEPTRELPPAGDKKPAAAASDVLCLAEDWWLIVPVPGRTSEGEDEEDAATL